MCNNHRIAFFVADMAGAGAQRVMLNLINGVVQRKKPVDVVIGRAVGPYLKQISSSARIIDLKATRLLFALPALIRYLRKEKPTALLSALFFVNIIALWAKLISRVPTRVVVSEHNTLSHSLHNASRIRKILILCLIRWFYPWADAIIAVSKGVANDLSQLSKVPRHKIQVIYNPVITKDLEHKSRLPISHSWFPACETPVILTVGRLDEQKDFANLINAFSLIRKTRRIRLIILGEGPKRWDLESMVDNLGLTKDVSLPGFVENPYAYMKSATMFVLSSLFEGLPTVLIEALYCGTPVIATDCHSGPREILEDGKYGQLVPVRNTPMLAKSIETYLTRPPLPPSQECCIPYMVDSVVNQYIKALTDCKTLF